MTFYPQHTSYECGPFALKHALALVGVHAEEHGLGQRAGTTTAGTDEAQLGRAAAAHGFDLPTHRTHDPESARHVLRDALAAGRPALACVDHWSHWIVIAQASGDRYVIVDSADDPVFDVVTWGELEGRWAYRDAAMPDAPSVYDLNPLTARIPTPTVAQITPELAKRLGSDWRELAREWGGLAAALLPLGEPARGGEDDPAVTPVTSLLAANRTLLLDRVDGSGPSHRAAAAAALEGVVAVADAYGLRVLPRHRRDAVAHAEALMRRMVGRGERGPRRSRAGVAQPPGDPSPTP